MAERIVSIKLRADASGMVQGFAAARDSAAELKAEVKESAMSQREAWAQVGIGLAAVGAAITGIGIAALKTGIEYNTMQQTTRAALTTLLGSAQAANAQMDKLDAFARNSPFAKQTFITAQQQMLAFGIETQKVIPYMDALQNAVAASGGSNNDIAELAEIFGKVQASAKITAIDLQQFGRRGVNAAELIGSQMGKTGAEIRSEITAGTLDAGKALDALAAGMSEQYAGAAANVKNTFAGAMDRVKAAWRDFSAELARPLVDPNGGGALVELLNWTADAMRNFEKLPVPVKFATTSIVGLTGAVALAGSTFLLAYPKMLQLGAALASVGVTSTVVKASLMSTLRFLTGPWGIALMATALTYAALSKAGDAATTTSDGFTTSLKRQSSLFETMQSNAAKQTDWANDFKASYEDLGGVLDKAAKHTSDFSRWWNILWTDRIALDSIKEAGDALAELAGTDLKQAQEEFAKFGKEAGLSGAQLATALDEMPAYKNALVEIANGAGLATDDTTLLKIATGELTPTTTESAAEAARAGSRYMEMADAARAVWKEMNSLIDSLNYFNNVGQTAETQNAKFQETLANVRAHIDKAREGVDGYSLSLDSSTVEGSRNRSMLADLASQSQATAKALYEQEVNTLGVETATANYTSRLSEGRNSLADIARQFGLNDVEAQKFADTIYRMPTKKEFKALADTAQAEADLKYLTRDRNIKIATWVDSSGAQRVDNWAFQANGGTVGYAGGGTILKAAGGRTIPGIGGGVHEGTVWGRGTAKSDSVATMLSAGEEVIQEPYASANRPLLKAINRGEFVSSMMQPQIIVQRGADQAQVVNNWNGSFIGEPPQAWSEDANQKQRRAQESHGVRDIR